MIRIWIMRLMLLTVFLGVGASSFSIESRSGDYYTNQTAFHKLENLQGTSGLTGVTTIIPQQAPFPEKDSRQSGLHLPDFDLPAATGARQYMCIWINIPIRTGKSNLIYPFHTFW